MDVVDGEEPVVVELRPVVEHPPAGWVRVLLVIVWVFVLVVWGYVGLVHWDVVAPIGSSDGTPVVVRTGG